VGILRTAAVLAWRNADPAGLLALGEPLCATAAARPDAVPADLADPAATWGVAALYEHLWADGKGAEPWRVVRQLPGGAELAALGSRYGIGPVMPGPHRDAPARVPAQRQVAQPAGGPDVIAAHSAVCPPDAAMPSSAHLRLLAAVVSGGDALRAARDDLPPQALGDVALESMRIAAGYGDLAGAFAAVLSEVCQTDWGTVAERYHAMVDAYRAGRWGEALACARRIEAYVRGPGAAGPSVLARVLAAEIHCATGDQQRALAWLGQVPDTVVHPLGGWVRLGVRYRSGDPDEAFDGGWRDVRRARESGLLEGLERLLGRLFLYGGYEDRPEITHRAVKELEALYEESGSPRAGEVLLLARSVLRRAPDRVRQVLDLAWERGDLPLRLLCLDMGALADSEPELWLAAAIEEAHALGARHIERSPLGHRARAYGLILSSPRRRAADEGAGELDLRLVEMVGGGATNRQIAVRLACSEKTVEQHLTRLFRQTGCRSRSELAAAWLDGRLAGLGLPADPRRR
jgi:hypothetical protein